MLVFLENDVLLQMVISLLASRLVGVVVAGAVVLFARVANDNHLVIVEFDRLHRVRRCNKGAVLVEPRVLGLWTHEDRTKVLFVKALEPVRL